MGRSNAGSIISRGYSEAGRGISRGIDNIVDLKLGRRREAKQDAAKEKESTEMMKGFKIFYDNSPELQDALGIDDFDNLSPNSVRGMMQGISAKAAMADEIFRPSFIPAEDVGGPKGGSVFMQNKGQGMYIPGKDMTGPGTAPVYSDDGRFYINPGSNKWRPVPSSQSATPKISAYEVKKNTTRRAEILQEIEELQGNKKESGEKKGWDKWPGGETFNERIQDLENELQGIDAVLMGGGSKQSRGSANMPNSKTPSVGQIVDGYVFLGGDPSDQNNWDRE